ncbi:branched-chain amino acid ABC transporter permease [Halocalculus aciditolerans]|uniref:Branched-chain amino acid ABC transporter permease n=1 Tax=Halocalculus aciditolerans TaxID=1383812 RepID=A0A830FM22_9EURY|nr:branched-chain amino acid ABC transporter permease [Halocalculus aciditolerans]GGL65999.1 branched-chain amino acid ABC transporter permease [Halocalculus aciditolerans]
MVLLETLVNGLIQGSIYALFAASFTIIFGVMDIPNMAHAALFAGGAYVFYQATILTGLPWPVGIVVAVIAIGLLGAILERGIFARLYDRTESEYVFAIILATLGLARIFERAFAQVWGHEPKEVPLAGLQSGSLHAAGVTVTSLELLVFIFSIASFAFLYWVINHTETGLGLQAIVQDRDLARLKGVNVGRTFLIAFVLGSSMAGVAGVLNAAMFSLTPDMGSSLLIKAFIVVILGGIGRVVGAAVAGYALGIYEAFAILYLSSYYIYATEFAVLILFFLLKAVVLSEGEDDLGAAIADRVRGLTEVTR